MKKTAFIVALIVLSNFSLFAQEKDNTNLHVEVKDDKKPLIIVDGKKFDFPMDLIDQTKIKSISLLHDNEYKELYNTSNEVILITTKASGKSSSFVTKEKSKNLKKPMIIINGKISDQATFDTINSEQIEKINVWKGEKAIEKYNSPNGVIVITTKKK